MRAAAGVTAPPLLLIASSAEIESRQLRWPRAPAIASCSSPCSARRCAEATAAALGLAPAPVTAAALLSAPEAIGGHVLLVEDEAVNAAVAQGYLEALGCTWVWVKDGPEAVARTRRGTLRPHTDGSEHADHGRLCHHGADPAARGRTRARAHRRAERARRGDLPRGLPGGRHGRHAEQALHPGCVRAAAASLAAARARGTCRQLPSHAPELAAVDAKAVASLRNLRTGGSEDLYSKLVALFQTGSAESLAALELAMGQRRPARGRRAVSQTQGQCRQCRCAGLLPRARGCWSRPAIAGNLGRGATPARAGARRLSRPAVRTLQSDIAGQRMNASCPDAGHCHRRRR